MLLKIQQRKAQALWDIFVLSPSTNIYCTYKLDKKKIKDLFRCAKKKRFWVLGGEGGRRGRPKQAKYPTKAPLESCQSIFQSLHDEPSDRRKLHKTSWAWRTPVMAIKKCRCRAWILKYIKTTLLGLLNDLSSKAHPCPLIANALKNLRAELPQEAVGGLHNYATN